MNLKKLYALTLAAGLILQTTVAAQTAKTDKTALSPELKESVVKTLRATASETQQLGAAENRVRTQVIAADLLWEHDEKEARGMFQTALGELQNLFAAINLPEGIDELTRAEKVAHYNKREELADLRREMVLSLAPRDPQTALDAFSALKIKTIDQYDPLAPDELELKLTAAVARKDPEKSFAVAKRQFEANGLTFQFVEALKKLHIRDSQIAAAVAKDVADKIKSSKIHIPLEPAQSAREKQAAEIDFYQIAHFINTASELNRTAARDKGEKVKPLLAAAEMKELVEFVANAFLTTANASPLAMSQVMSEVAQFTPAAVQKIRAKIGAANARQLEKIIESHDYYVLRNEKSAAELVKIAELAAPEVREQRIADAAFKALEENDALEAEKIAARLKNRQSFDYLFDRIREKLPLAKARRGDPAEVRRLLSAMKTNGEKIQALTEFAFALAAKDERGAAVKLLDEAMIMMPASIRTASEVESALKIAAAYSVVAPEQAFTILENSISQSDEFIAAGIKMSEFFADAPPETSELAFKSVSHQYLLIFPEPSDLLKNLAKADFSRTVGLADKFQRPEIRLFARLLIMRNLLDENAVEKEEAARDQLTGDYEG